ncbi:6-phosphogluconolactonase [Nocardioides dokdonensis FR1436]|uniref:6-phosphogluconolactonase n=1 Tax=Nocardioides dokdonensis FR1436 TaxID=1300347 RepID=A0A1A9GQG0_9ACTN|nr:6-phosphogluconolactonase [Nocardioides dokdonensis]ANH39833.1 6-phosphogluconolactonase [Nocardioides dokdonensis FR1436]
MATEPLIEVHDDAATLATAVAGELLTRLADAQSAGRVPHVVLTGGSIAGAIHAEVARLSSGTESPPVDWTQVALWWGDDRFVPAASEDRNALQARTAFIEALAIPAAHVHEVPSTDDVATAEEAAQRYADALVEHGADQFEVLMLGVGPDGHVASLFPGFEQLDVRDRDVAAVHDSPKPPPDRVTLTFAALERARSTWFLVSGEEKAEAVARALSPATTSGAETPASVPRGREETTWFLDRAAASRL